MAVLSSIKTYDIFRAEIRKGRKTMEDQIKKIEELKKEKNAVILAHYYVVDEIQDIADYVGDSYYLSDMATKVKEKTIILCGVTFMGESAKILNPDKTVIVPDMDAICPMALMASVEGIKEVREAYDDVAVVCYVNSTADLKANSDVCVTSSNALKIVKSLPQKNIYFIPDENLGRYVASKIPEKNFIFNEGYCHVHDGISVADVKAAKEKWPKALVLAHPECREDVLALADYIGSTSGIIGYAGESDSQEFIICTEIGVIYELRNKNPEKKFYVVNDRQVCPNMKKLTLDKVIKSLETGEPAIELTGDFIEAAHAPLEKMLELSK